MKKLKIILRNFAPNLKSARIKKGLTQHELAEKIQGRNGSISQYERGVTYPTLGVLTSLVHVLNCEYTDLLNEEAEKNLDKSHMFRRDRLRTTWKNMKERCYNKKCPSYKRYGGRGITICPEWMASFLTFYEWSVDNGYKDKLTIDRIDNNKGYYPSNCRFVTTQMNILNREATKLTFDMAEEIRRKFKEEGIDKSTLAVDYNISEGHVSKVIKREFWNTRITK